MSPGVKAVTETLIIGGGAAGMAAAVAAGMRGEKVLVLERMDRVGKKLLATGNGRCNLMNAGVPRYPGGAAFARTVLERCGAAEQARFWRYWGLSLRQEEDGRVYPASGQASTVLDTLRLALSATGAAVETGTPVRELRRAGRGFEVRAGERVVRAERVIVAGGGCAQPKLGSDGSAWDLLAPFGHRRTPVRPALTQIMTDTAPIRGLSGIRIRCRVTVLQAGRALHEETGELLFTDYGVSGVCVMQCARYVEPDSELRLDFTDGMGLSDAAGELRRRRKLYGSLPMESLLTGLCVPRLASCLCQAAGIRWKERTAASLTDGEIDRLARTLGGLRLRCRGVKGFESAQVTAGGLMTDAFHPATLESRLCPGLHACGEMLDVDGDCGGFNLMFAFGSGLLAGVNGQPFPWRNV